MAKPEQLTVPNPATTQWVPVGGTPGPQGPAGPTGPTGPTGTGVPTPVVNGQWIKGVGGAAVWSNVVSTRVVDASAALTDLPVPVGLDDTVFLNPGGGSIRSIATTAVANGTRVTFWNWIGAPPITLKHSVSGGGGVLWLRDQADVVLQSAYDSLAVVWDSGRSLWIEVGRNIAVPYGTSLPANPYQGQEAILVDSVTAPSWQWRFRYNAGSTSAYKWEFIGGIPYVLEPGGSEVAGVGTNGAWWGFAPTAAVPRSGVYVVEFTTVASTSPSAHITYIAAYSQNAAGPIGEGVMIAGPASANTVTYQVAMREIVTLAANDHINLSIMSGNAQPGNWNVSNRSLSLTPARLS